MSKKLKIALVFDDSLDSSDGVSMQVKTIGEWLSSQGHQVSYLVGQTKLTSWAGGRVYSLAKNLKVSFNGNQMSIPLLSSKRRIKQLIKDGQFDVIHVMAPYSPFMAARVIKAADPTCAVVASFHIFPANSLAGLGGRLLGLWLAGNKRRIDQWLSVSSAAQKFAKQSFGVSAKLVPNTIDIKSFETGGTQPAKGRIVYLGRLVRRKGPSQLIEAFAILSKRKEGLSLAIGGKGPDLDKLTSQVKRLGLEDKVTFEGFIEPGKKADFLASGQIVCFPSLGGESFGIVLLEAMAAGRGVVVAGDNAGYRCVLEARPAQLADVSSPAVLADSIESFLDDKAKADEAAKWQKSEVQKYDINVVGPALLSEYSAAIAKRRASGA